MTNLNFKLGLFNSFIGNITKNIISIAYSYIDNKINIYATTELKPSEEDYEGLDIAITEFISSHQEIKEQYIEIKQLKVAISELSSYDGFLYLRKLY